jgi:hypothetical protein
VPEGKHWEWRAFGQVSAGLTALFETLPLRYPVSSGWDATTDEYIWVPRVRINAKLRSGGDQRGLKLKRLVAKRGDLELWSESPNELYPLETINDHIMVEIANALEISLSPILERDTQKVLDRLRIATPVPTIVKVEKIRQTRLTASGVQVELARITQVSADNTKVGVEMPLFSLALENQGDLGDQQDNLSSGWEQVMSLLNELRVRDEALHPMNYLDAIAFWLSRKQ